MVTVIESAILWFLDKLLIFHQFRFKINVMVHRAIHYDHRAFLHVKITNRSKGPVEITHLWIVPRKDQDIPKAYSNFPQRRLEPMEQCEISVPIDELPGIILLEYSIRVLTTYGKIVKSRWNKSVPLYGQEAKCC